MTTAPLVSLIATRSSTNGERLAPPHVAVDGSGGAGAHELVVVLLRGHAGPLRPVHDLVPELVVGDLDLLPFGERVEQRAGS